MKDITLIQEIKEHYQPEVWRCLHTRPFSLKLSIIPEKKGVLWPGWYFMAWNVATPRCFYTVYVISYYSLYGIIAAYFCMQNFQHFDRNEMHTQINCVSWLHFEFLRVWRLIRPLKEFVKRTTSSDWRNFRSFLYPFIISAWWKLHGC